MNTIITVFLKELKVTIRDKRTLMTTILLPAVIFPLMIVISGKITQKVSASQNEEKIKIAVLNAPNDFNINYFSNDQFKLLDNYTNEVAQIAIQDESLDVLIDFSSSFSQNIDSNKTGEVSIYHKSTNLSVFKKTENQVSIYKNKILKNRLSAQNISEELINPIQIKGIDIATKKEQLGDIIGGLLPYIFVIFCFIGCMYPAIELTTGENEKNTLETLLTTPASRYQILLGKVLTMTLIGTTAAIITIAGIFLCTTFFKEIPKELATSLQEVLNIKSVFLLLGMLIPLAFFFSSTLSGLAMSAQSFKEAQSKTQPVMFFVLLPIIVGFIPGVTLDYTTAFIPILNISLTSKAIISDSLDLILYLITLFSNIIIAVIAIFLSYKQFSKESMILN